MDERVKVVTVRPYGQRVHIIVSSDILASFKKRRLPVGENKGPDSPYAFVWTHRGCKDIFAFLPEKCGIGATAHEMLHVVDFIMDITGVGYCEEVWAYHLEELTQMAAEFVHADKKDKYNKEEKENAANKRVHGVSGRKGKRLVKYVRKVGSKVPVPSQG
jgi:hypothetical protein